MLLLFLFLGPVHLNSAIRSHRKIPRLLPPGLDVQTITQAFALKSRPMESLSANMETFSGDCLALYSSLRGAMTWTTVLLCFF